MELYDRIVDPNLLVRRITINANHIVPESSIKKETTYEQLDLFTDYKALEEERKKEEAFLEKEKNLQKQCWT